MTIYWAMFAMFALAALTFNPAVAGHPHSLHAETRAPIAPLIATLFLIVLVGLRYQVGGDWHNYEVDFDRSRYETLASLLNQPKEPGYALVVWLASQLDAGLWFVNLILAIPFCWGLTQLSRQQPNPWLALVVATPFLIIVVGMGFARQAAALGFLMAGLARFVRTGSLPGFILLCVAGSLFHRTVLVFLPIILLATGPNRLVSATMCVAAVALIYFTVFSSSVEYYSQGYLQNRFDAAGAKIRTMMNVVPATLVLLARDRFYRSPRERTVWRTFAILALLSGIAIFVVTSSVIVDRLAMYLIPLQMFVLGRLPIVASATGAASVAWRTAVIGYSAAVLFVWLNYGHYASGWQPYRSYLSGEQ